MDPVNEELRSEALAKITSMGEWAAVEQLEEDLLTNWQNKTLSLNPVKDSDQILRESIYLKGLRDAVGFIRAERRRILKNLKEQEDKNKRKARSTWFGRR